MNNNELTTLAFETDTQLSSIYSEITKTKQRLDSAIDSLHFAAGHRKSYYRSKWGYYEESVAQTVADIEALLAAAEAGPYVRISTGYCRQDIEAMLVRRLDLVAELVELGNTMQPLNAIYAEHKWSRFFLVTSSAGHVHSSMACSTTRPTTGFAWLPELSGHSEADAVAKLGSTLCSVCFASAPVEFIGGKITKAAAAKLAS